ncbi:hypothetical protein WICPIJ_001088 [Wickerhamomyces pijperi]|uniref:Uncharacterized protein n=1 Tax=Wickerhamomyces pijperi TaxID=599730 RepID=A0A9P8QBE4_WICPI|nr:hypothetical protein WICPIJ_001088 [Wickerhamomyces pijperi]
MDILASGAGEASANSTCSSTIVSGSHVLDFFSGSVGGTWIRHGVTTVSVGFVLQDQWTVTGDGPVLSELGGLVTGQDVHTVDLQTWDVLTSLVVVSQGGGSGGRGTHTVLVVFTGEDGCGVHVHGTTLTVGDTATTTHQFTQDSLDWGASHVGEPVTSVGGDDGVLLVDGVFNTNSNGFLTNRQVTETSNLLGLVKGVGGHFHSSDDDHVLVHL